MQKEVFISYFSPYREIVKLYDAIESIANDGLLRRLYQHEQGVLVPLCMVLMFVSSWF